MVFLESWEGGHTQDISSKNMGVSKNRNTPKSSILVGFSIINHPFWGTSIFGNTHILLQKWQLGIFGREKPTILDLDQTIQNCLGVLSKCDSRFFRSFSYGFLYLDRLQIRSKFLPWILARLLGWILAQILHTISDIYLYIYVFRNCVDPILDTIFRNLHTCATHF